MALIDHRDAAEAGLHVLTDPALWGAHHDVTGPVRMSWPEALELLSAELGEPVTFRVAAEQHLLKRLIGAGVPAGTAELLITREWSILAGEKRLHDRHLPADHRPSSPPGGRVPSRVPRGIRLIPAPPPAPAFSSRHVSQSSLVRALLCAVLREVGPGVP
ncbi:MAG: hypothetical protein ACXVH3_26755 [Solirubrobacteraceae bacterium]